MEGIIFLICVVNWVGWLGWKVADEIIDLWGGNK